MRSYFPPQFASTSAWGSYGSYPYAYPVAGGFYPYAYPVAGGSYPYSYPMTGESYPYPNFHPWNMYPNSAQPWTVPQATWNHPTTPMVPSNPPPYQTEWEQPKPVWDSPESPQSPWLKAYHKQEQVEK
jgi:hypothetical protein